MKQKLKDDKKKKSELAKFWDANKYSIAGVRNFLKNESSAKRVIVACVLQIILSFWLKPPFMQSAFLWLCIMLIFAVELINTAIESICDLVSPEYNKLVKIAKDSGSAATYILSYFTGIMAVMIYLSVILGVTL